MRLIWIQSVPGGVGVDGVEVEPVGPYSIDQVQGMWDRAELRADAMFYDEQSQAWLDAAGLGLLREPVGGAGVPPALPVAAQPVPVRVKSSPLIPVGTLMCIVGIFAAGSGLPVAGVLGAVLLLVGFVLFVAGRLS